MGVKKFVFQNCKLQIIGRNYYEKAIKKKNGTEFYYRIRLTNGITKTSKDGE
ncbi:hypothetical protein [Proteiniborus sp. DW1]|uniref:hypothetical protein n=1 Tax=Proteiniborus sp. DW1 TaxID=1889883 RepID=UPI00135643C7|nr:hypothetical protein [Proteiniborus sp. DW1]